MNIVKFKDIILDADNAPQLTEDQRKLFNDRFKGRYVYSVDWMFCTPIESMSEEQYINVSQNLTNDEFGNVYTRINSFSELCDREGNIDTTKEYILGWSNNDDTFIPLLHSIDPDSWKNTYYPSTEIDDFVLSDKFNAENDIDQQLYQGTKLRVLPLVEQDDPERTFDLNGYGEVRTTTYFKYNTTLTVHCEYEGHLDISGYNDDDYQTYWRGYVTEGQDITTDIEYPSYRGVVIVGGDSDWEEEYFRYEFSYRDQPVLPAEGFFLQDTNFPYNIDSDDEVVDTDFNMDYYYVTQGSSNNVSYGNPELAKNSYKRGNTQSVWTLNSSDQGIGLFSNNSRFICYNISSPRFNLYNPNSNNKLAGLYRREVLTPQSLEGFDILPYKLLTEYINVDKTDQANDITYYLAANKYASDADITIDELKVFRRWLALYLLAFDQDDEGKQRYKLYDDATTHMLQYYANDIYDDIIKYLTEFGSDLAVLSSSTSACGCNAIGTVGGLVTANYIQQQVLSKANCGCDTSALAGKYSLSTCDPIMIYRKNIYMKMVNVFSNIDFWNQFSVAFITDFKRYIDGILDNNFSLTTSQFVSVFADCGCLSEADAEQQKNQAILRDLSKSLQYLLDNEVSGHKNFVQNSLIQWSSLLYENMFWA